MLLCSASTCGIFSLIGIFFLISVGIMLEVQPLYIKGIKDHTPDEVATACYEGAAIYAATFIVSVGYIYYKKGASSSRRGESAVLIGEANQSNYGKYFVLFTCTLNAYIKGSTIFKIDCVR